jgi:alpha-galactosidase
LLGFSVVTLVTIAIVTAPALRPAEANTIAANNATGGIALGAKPMMGFNNWARFECEAQARLDGTTTGYSFQQFMKDQADAMVQTGLVAAGYTNLTVDDCWMQRTQAGYLHGAATWNQWSTQPGFDWELTDYANYVHSKGMQVGLYSTSGVNTCQQVPGGVMGHEQADANSMAYWGADSLKLDNCGTDYSNRQTQFTTMANALNTATAGTTRKILFNESAPAGAYPNSTIKYETMDWVRGLGQMWRVGPDITTWLDRSTGQPHPAWDDPRASAAYQGGVIQSFLDTVALARYNGPGNFNDADMLLIGDNNQLTIAEQRSQFALWSAMASPLMISTDVRKMAANQAAYQQQLSILKNSDIIAVDQDSLGAGGYLASRDNWSGNGYGFDVVVKPMSDGSRAVVVLNKNSAAANYTLDLGVVGFDNLGCWRTARDLWSHTDSWVQGSITRQIGGHDNATFRIYPGSCGGATPVGVIQEVQSDFQASALCLDAYGSSDGSAVKPYTCHGGNNQKWKRLSNGLIASYSAPSLCISGDGVGMRLRPCNSGDSTQVWTYKRSGQLRQSNGACMDVFSSQIGVLGATVGTYWCGSYQPNQTWSAPFATPPAG